MLPLMHSIVVEGATKIDRHEDNVMHTVRPRSVIVGLVGLLVLAAWGSAQAQMQPASAELVRATGRVDLMPKGQTAWTPAIGRSPTGRG